MLVEETLKDLEEAGCIETVDEKIVATPIGKIASNYYLDYKTVKMFASRLQKNYQFFGSPDKGERIDGDFISLLRILSDATEYDELPVRHNGKKHII